MLPGLATSACEVGGDASWCNSTFDLVLDNGPRAPNVMRPGPKKPAVAGPRTIIQNHTESTMGLVR